MRGEEPKESDFRITTTHQQDLEQWQNWKPLFEGEWDIVDSIGDRAINFRHAGEQYFCRIGYMHRFKTLNDFAYYCRQQGIKLMLR